MVGKVGGLICCRTSISKYYTGQGSNMQMLMHYVEIQWDQPRMMMISMKKARILEVYKLTQLGQKMRSSLFRLARVQNGSVLGDKKKGFYKS